MRARSVICGVILLVCVCLLPSAWAEPEAEPTFAGMGVKVTDITRALATERPISLRPVGTTAVVFKMDLQGEIDGAFKPESKRHPKGHLAEVAAFRIGRALNMDNIAPAVPRVFRRSELDAWVPEAERAAYAPLATEMIERAGSVTGAVIYWIPEMAEIGIDTAEGIQQWRRWLSQKTDGPSRDRSKLVAAQVSTMIAFDVLIGNWDRFSGANAQGDKGEKHLFIRDHNVAFFDPLPPNQLRAVTTRMTQVERFSRAFVTQLKALDEANLRMALKRPADPDGYRALTESQIAGVLDRRRTLLSYLAALIDVHGEENVLTFP